MKPKKTLSYIAMIIGTAGIVTVGLNSNWMVAAGMFMFLYGDNIQKYANTLKEK